ncbi:hypothetical protein LTS10_006275 [Elasticomyces elasticus]|nr:hypothetical protein LTS10_006275 [Elasticomyces elasticus]
MAATWAALIKEDKSRAAGEIEAIGKAAFGDNTFQTAMAAATGGDGLIGEEENENEGGSG